MTTKIITLTRLFRFGATTLEDVDPAMPPEDVLKAYTTSYPFLAHATLGEPVVEGDTLVYPVQKREVQTKGASRRASASLLAAEQALLGWAEAAPEKVPTTGNAGPWGQVAVFVHEVINRDPTPVTDAMLVPML